jgi:hypothetical protein
VIVRHRHDAPAVRLQPVHGAPTVFRATVRYCSAARTTSSSVISALRLKNSTRMASCSRVPGKSPCASPGKFASEFAVQKAEQLDSRTDPSRIFWLNCAASKRSTPGAPSTLRRMHPA